MARTHICPINELQVKLCNCAECRITLLGDSMRSVILPKKYKDYPFVGGRIKGRPYCDQCLMLRGLESKVIPIRTDNAWLQNGYSPVEGEG